MMILRKKPINQKRNFIFYITVIVILIIVSVYVLEVVLYNATFAYKKQPMNKYEDYSSFSYFVDNKKIDVVYKNRHNKDVFIYFHGNVGRLNYILDYLNKHTSFLAPAYPGYHRSEGEPSVNGTLDTVSGLLTALIQEFGDDVRFHVIGHSLGTQTASYFAHLLKKDNRLKTLSLVAGFPSIKSQCENVMGVFSLLCFPANKSFNASDYLEDIGNITIWVYHLPTDSRIPYRDGRKLFDNIKIKNEEYFPKKKFYDFTSGTHGEFDIKIVINNALKSINP